MASDLSVPPSYPNLRRLALYRSLDDRRHSMLLPVGNDAVPPATHRCPCGKEDVMWYESMLSYTTEYEPRCLLFGHQHYTDQRRIS